MKRPKHALFTLELAEHLYRRMGATKGRVTMSAKDADRLLQWIRKLERRNSCTKNVQAKSEQIPNKRPILSV